ncbi:MAG: class I SAM-dependent methyltransferase [Mycobacteriales bacterium]|nr:MAG: bifunctional 3-demethylubiquinone 3-O-methyltransferase/2-octaprenyl-6-hydroxy phenol methylase [Pseudonocardiales bacterium]
MPAPRRARNDPKQYDDLVAEWWPPRGAFAMLHWLAAARARRIPPARAPGTVLLDVGCGAGLLAPHIRTLGYRHIGVDVSASALALARTHGVAPCLADARRLPMADASAGVVVAGEILEHVPDLPAVIAEACRVLAPGGTLVVDTIAATRLARVVAVSIAERLPFGAPHRLHDPALFVDRERLVRDCARHGVSLRLYGLRPSIPALAEWFAHRRDDVPMVPTRLTCVLFGAVGVKAVPNRSATPAVRVGMGGS